MCIIDLSDRHPRSLLERNLCCYTGDERQAARLDKTHAVSLALYRMLVRVFLKFLRGDWSLIQQGDSRIPVSEFPEKEEFVAKWVDSSRTLNLLCYNLLINA